MSIFSNSYFMRCNLDRYGNVYDYIKYSHSSNEPITELLNTFNRAKVPEPVREFIQQQLHMERTAHVTHTSKVI